MDKEVRESVVREAKRNLILDAARKTFGEKPYHDVRLEDIAEVAGFSKASLYNYYQSKEAIFLNLAKREYDRLEEAIRSHMNPDISLNHSLRAMAHSLFSIIGEYFSLILSFSQLRANMLLHLAQLEVEQGDLLQECGKKFSALSGPFREQLALSRNKGEFASPLSDEDLDNYLGGLFRAVMMRWRMQGRMGDVDKEVDDVVTFFLNGINYLGEE